MSHIIVINKILLLLQFEFPFNIMEMNIIEWEIIYVQKRFMKNV